MRQPFQGSSARSLLLVALAATLVPARGFAGRGNSDGPATGARVDSGRALVQLSLEPLATSTKTRPAPGRKIDFNNSSVKAYRAQLSSQRNDFKAWLRANAPAARVTGEFDISLNAVGVELNGVELSVLSGAPQVKSAEHQGLYYPTGSVANDPDLALVQAVAAWNVGGGAAAAGEGIKVAIVDTGIDVGHPCFSDVGYTAAPQYGDPRFVNNKVIAARVFNNKSPAAHYTPEAIQSHGTHVAGTVACNLETAASVHGVSIPNGVTGVAPRARLGNYNVFPGNVDNARSEDILNALEAAYADGFDVANMSLGGGASGSQDLLTIAVDNLDRANMVVAVASGNSGPGFSTVESPGSAARALTAGASTVGHLVGTGVLAGANAYAGVAGDFATVLSNLTAPLGVVSSGGTLGLACSPLPAGSLTGAIALLSRGTCSFSTKIRNAQAAGAVAVLVVNNTFGDAISMGTDGTPHQPTVPAYMVSRNDGSGLLPFGGAPVTIQASLSYFLTGNNDIMAAFSSQGPTDVDFRVKPDVVAPGVNVLSAVPRSECGGAPCFAFFQGTSMATPHLAGSAAVVRWLHPDWTAAQVRSALVNTADSGVLLAATNGAVTSLVNVIGAGRENLHAAVEASVALDPVSVSFGAVPSGSGQTRTASVALQNLGGASGTFSVAVDAGDTSVSYSVSPASVTLSPGESATVTVTAVAARSAAGGGHQARLAVTQGGAEVAHAVVYTLIK